MSALANRFIEPASEFPDDQTQKIAYAPDGFNSNQNAAVGMVKQLVATWFNKEDVLKAIPMLHAAIVSNEPKLTLAEAVEIRHQLYGFYIGYFGSSEPQLLDLLHAIEDLYPSEAFE